MLLFVLIVFSVSGANGAGRVSDFFIMVFAFWRAVFDAIPRWSSISFEFVWKREGSTPLVGGAFGLERAPSSPSVASLSALFFVVAFFAWQLETWFASSPIAPRNAE